MSHPGDERAEPRHDRSGDETVADLEAFRQARAAAAGGDAAGQELAEARDRLLRAQAELENFRRRSRREFEEAQRYREIDLLRDLLPVLDNLHRAVEAADKTTDIDSLRAGFKMTAQQIEKLLEAHGCRVIDTDGRPFDPTVHDAVLEQVVPGQPAGAVVGVGSRGYVLHDRVVRPAQVIVAKEG